MSLDDTVRAITFLIEEPTAIAAPTTSPRPSLRPIVRSLPHWPALCIDQHCSQCPAPAIRLVLGEFADAVLGSMRVVPVRLEAAGFEFAHRTVDEIFAAALD